MSLKYQVLLHCDNKSAIQTACNDVFHERTEHIESDATLIRHHLLNGIISLWSVSSSNQLPDIFIKSQSPARFRDLIDKLKMSSSSPYWVWRGMLMFIPIFRDMFFIIIFQIVTLGICSLSLYLRDSFLSLSYPYI